MVVRQYPYNLYVLNAPPAYQNENGDWVTDTPEWEFVTKCRDEVNTGKVIVLEDGTMFNYSCVVYIPKKAITAIIPKVIGSQEEGIINNSNIVYGTFLFDADGFISLKNNQVFEIREDDDTIRFHGTIRLFKQFQQNCKIWA